MSIEHSVIKNGAIYFVEISHDEGATNPAAGNTGECVIYSLGRNHKNFNPEKIEEIMTTFQHKDNKPYVMLSYHEHGTGVWSVSGEGPSCEFDSVQKAGLFYAGQDFVDMTANENPSFFNLALLSFARCVCKDYSAWCNGETYLFSIHKAAYDFEIDIDFDEYEDQGLLEAVDGSNNYYSHHEAYQAAISRLQAILDEVS